MFRACSLQSDETQDPLGFLPHIERMIACRVHRAEPHAARFPGGAIPGVSAKMIVLCGRDALATRERKPTSVRVFLGSVPRLTAGGAEIARLWPQGVSRKD